MSDLEDLSLRKLVALRDEFKMSFFAVEFFGMNFHPSAPY
jgi:hypothetical protein